MIIKDKEEHIRYLTKCYKSVDYYYDILSDPEKLGQIAHSDSLVARHKGFNVNYHSSFFSIKTTAYGQHLNYE